MVRIVNWLLTRRCNLSCEYCGIVRVGGKKRISHFRKNEISADRVIRLLDKFSKYNPNIFHIFYGGEPFLRGDLSDILRFCNECDIEYTVISNCTPDIQPKILKVMNDIGGLKGLTASIDPSILSAPDDTHSQMKSSAGFHFLMRMKHHTDVVAEVTMTRPQLGNTYNLIKMLSDVGIYTSLTAIDINKNYNYDFSAYSSLGKLIRQNRYLNTVYDQIMSDDSLLIHMKHIVVPELFKHIESTYDCEIEDSLHNLTIDADGKPRLCLRVRGYHTEKFDDSNIVLMTNPYGYEISHGFKYAIETDKQNLCRGCNHTCMMMSKHINDHEEDQNKLRDH